MANYTKLENLDNYSFYQRLVTDGRIDIYTKDINSESHLDHFNGILNILRDGIEQEEVQSLMINVIFDDGQYVEINIFDYFINLIMWKSIIDLDMQILPIHLFMPENITQRDIKNFLDSKFLIPYRDEYNVLKERGYDPETASIILNQCIDNGIYGYSFIDEFSMYLMNTMNLEDDFLLWKKVPRYYELLHPDLSDVPIEQKKDAGMDLEREAVNIIKNSDHCLADSFKAEQGVNIKQDKEFRINIGTKPDGLGSAFPTSIDTSFINGGVNTLESFFIESNSGRLAQIIAKCNVGTSGAFARILGLNNRDSILHKDPNYVCESTHFETIIMKDPYYLYAFNGRYYRTHPLGMEKVLSMKDTHLIGKKLYIRSPMKCASAARGEGICYRCYGKLAYTNASINIGQFAAEIISSQLTQKQLSAKHLLESLIIALEWVEDFNKFFEVEFNAIVLKQDMNYNGIKIVIDPNDIQLQSEEDDYLFNEFITSFTVIDSDGCEYLIHTKDVDPIYISTSLNEKIRKLNKSVVEGDKLVIPLSGMESDPIFLMNLMNDEFSATLERIKSIINLEKVTTSFDTHQILQEFNDAIKEGKLGVTSVHLEVILMNQLRKKDDILLNPDWSNGNEENNIQIITLNKALSANPSITKTLMYRISNTYYNPLSFKKKKASYLDLLFMEKPQFVFQNSGLYEREINKHPYEKAMINAVSWDDTIDDGGTNNV